MKKSVGRGRNLGEIVTHVEPGREKYARLVKNAPKQRSGVKNAFLRGETRAFGGVGGKMRQPELVPMVFWYKSSVDANIYRGNVPAGHALPFQAQGLIGLASLRIPFKSGLNQFGNVRASQRQLTYPPTLS
jgi:hypothetical protein